MAATAAQWLQPGCTAQIHSLFKRADLNGKPATVLEPQGSRWRVQVAPTGGSETTVVDVRPENLKRPEPEHIGKRPEPSDANTALVGSKRPRPGDPTQAGSLSGAPPCASPCSHEACVKQRLLQVLPAAHRRTKEPEPEQLFAPHFVPAVHAEAHLRIATWNLLECSAGNGPRDPRGIHAVFDVRRINVLRAMLALDADVCVLQELVPKSRAFLAATLPTHTLLGNVLFRSTPSADLRLKPLLVQPTAALPSSSAAHLLLAPSGLRMVGGRHPTRGVWLEPLEPRPRSGGIYRNQQAKEHGGSQLGYLVSLPLLAHGLPGRRAPQRVAFATCHLAPKGVVQARNGGMVGGADGSASDPTDAFVGALGRALLRLPTRHDAPLLLGGDFNAGKASALYDRLTQRRSLRAEGQRVDSEDEWEEDCDEELAWPPVAANVRLARDLFREPKEEERLHAGLQRGSTATQFGMQSEPGQGLRARARAQGWPEAGRCSDEGHIDWLLTAHEFAKGCSSRVQALRVGVCTERMCSPLPPRQPTELGQALPSGGCVFPSDHYPVWADVQFVPT